MNPNALNKSKRRSIYKFEPKKHTQSKEIHGGYIQQTNTKATCLSNTTQMQSVKLTDTLLLVKSLQWVLSRHVQ